MEIFAKTLLSIAFLKSPNKFGFKSTDLIFNSLEGQLNPYKLWENLVAEIQANNIHIIIDEIAEVQGGSTVNLNGLKNNYKAGKAIIANNAFAKKLIKDLNVFPNRGQVLISKPIPNLKIQGTFHMNKGYVYFRNVGNRLLIGGGRDLDVKKEQTDRFETTDKIQSYLTHLVNTEILPDNSFELDMSWSGIMGFGDRNQKEYIVESVDQNVCASVRLGGMGVALAPILAQKAVAEFN